MDRTWLTIEDPRRKARRRLPPLVFDTIEGGSGDESALCRNRSALERLAIVPNVLSSPGPADLSVTLLGRSCAAPLVVAPTGMSGFYWPRGEIAMARAAAANGIVYILSCISSVSLEEVASAASGPKWFQLYLLEDHGLSEALVERAWTSGYEALVVTVDTPVIGQRVRDLRNKMRIPPQMTPAFTASMLAHPRWAAPFIAGYRLSLANFAVSGRSRLSLPAFNGSASWRDVERLRNAWPGPLVVKGVMRIEDISRARDCGASAVIISNHGGRQLDCACSTVEALRRVTGADIEILVDGGIRDGGDILKLLALGARACAVGRALLYGLAAAGEAGASRAIAILVEQLGRSMHLAGCAGPSAAADCLLVEESGAYHAAP